MNDLQQKLAELKNQFSDIKPSLSLDKKREKLAKLTEMSTDPNLWDNPQNAQKIMREVSVLKKEIEAVEKLDEDLSTLYELAKLAGSTEDLNKEVNKYFVKDFGTKDSINFMFMKNWTMSLAEKFYLAKL